MKKIFTIAAGLMLALSMSAQLAWETEMTESDFNNPLTVISKTENASFSNPVLGIGGGLSLGKISLIGTYSDECVIALPQTGIAEKLTFSWQGGSSGSITAFQSADHNTWTQVYTAEGNMISLDTDAEALLSANTRYIKFAATGKTAVSIRKIKVTELKSLGASTDEWPFGSGMVDDADATKSVTISWTNIIAEVHSTDPHFAASLSSVGQKNLIEQSTQLVISYSHSEAGSHNGEIIIAGEGKEVRIAVSGETRKYDQTLTWLQTPGECIATDRVSFNAYTSSGLEVVYESSDNTVAYAENNIVHIIRAGEVTFTATQPGNYKFNAATPISKTLVIRKADPMAGVHADDITYGQPLREAVLVETVGQVEGTLSWQEIDTDSILNAGDYVLQVLFTPANTGIYNTRTMPVALHINKAPQTILWEEQETSLTVGQNVVSTAVLSSGMPITYAYTECLLNIENGIIMPENEGEVTVVAYHPGDANYLPTTVIMQTFAISAAPETPTRTEQLTAEQQRNARKYLHAGKMYLYYGGCLYDASGKRIQ